MNPTEKDALLVILSLLVLMGIIFLHFVTKEDHLKAVNSIDTRPIIEDNLKG